MNPTDSQHSVFQSLYHLFSKGKPSLVQCICLFYLFLNIISKKSQSGEDSASEGVICVAFLTGIIVAIRTRIHPPKTTAITSNHGRIRSAPCSSQNVRCKATWNAIATSDPLSRPSREIQDISVAIVFRRNDF